MSSRDFMPASSSRKEDFPLVVLSSPQENAPFLQAHSSQDARHAASSFTNTEDYASRKMPHTTSEEHIAAPKRFMKNPFRSFTISRALLFLVISNIVLIAINLLQILFLDRIQHNYMIYAPSAGVLLLFIAGVLAYTVFHASKTREVWRDAQRAKKASWVGAILAIMLPVILCQFFYLTLWGFPEHQQKQWTTEMVNNGTHGLRPPYLYIYRPEGAATLTSKLSGCKIVRSNVTTRCDQYVGYVTGEDNSTIAGHRIYFSDENVVLDGQGYSNYVQIDSRVQWNSAVGQAPTMSYAIIDPRLWELNNKDLKFAHTCELVTWVVVPALALNSINVEQINIQDNEHALLANNSNTCGSSENVGYYRVSVTSVALPEWVMATCDVSNRTGTYFDGAFCNMTTNMWYSSYLTTTFTSERKKDRKDIILDESSIAGGITFFTYFLSVFVL